jgi:hypothetical protein
MKYRCLIVCSFIMSNLCLLLVFYVGANEINARKVALMKVFVSLKSMCADCMKPLERLEIILLLFYYSVH